jgi:hypothetical protein
MAPGFKSLGQRDLYHPDKDIHDLDGNATSVLPGQQTHLSSRRRISALSSESGLTTYREVDDQRYDEAPDRS